MNSLNLTESELRDIITNSEEYSELINTLNQTREVIDDFVQHPEGHGNTKMWDSVGF